MAQKNRNDITNAISSNIYDNNNKEVMASMVRAVFNDFRDSFFNLLDDKLKDLKYEGNTTLQQHLNSIVGSLPEYGEVLNIDPGSSNLSSYSTSGIVSSARAIDRQTNDSLIEINFSKSVANRRIVPIVTYNSSEYWGNANDFGTPVLRRISSTRIHVAIRELSGKSQSINLEIIVI